MGEGPDGIGEVLAGLPNRGDIGAESRAGDLAGGGVERRAVLAVVLVAGERTTRDAANLADEAPAVVEELTRVMNRWLQKTNDPWLSAKQSL